MEPCGHALHLLVLDGAYTFSAQRPRFHRARAPTTDELERLLDTLIQAGALVVESEEEGAQPYLNLERPDDDALAALESASVRYRSAVGPTAGRKTLRLQAPGAISTAVESVNPLTATRDGFSLNAAVVCRARSAVYSCAVSAQLRQSRKSNADASGNAR